MKSLSLFFLIALACCLFSCNSNNDSKQSKPHQVPEFYSNWVLKSLIDSITKNHAIKPVPEFICSEICIKRGEDSIIFGNGDLEMWKEPFKVINSKEIDADQMMALPHSHLYIRNDELVYFDSAAGKLFTFVKADSTIFDPQHAGFALFSMINKILFEGTYTNLKDGSKVEFTKDQRVNGFYDFNIYEFFINGPVADRSEGDLISFASHSKNIAPPYFVWEYHGDTLWLYSSMNTECNYCKPFFEKGMPYAKLLRSSK